MATLDKAVSHLLSRLQTAVKALGPSQLCSGLSGHYPHWFPGYLLGGKCFHYLTVHRKLILGGPFCSIFWDCWFVYFSCLASADMSYDHVHSVTLWIYAEMSGIELRAEILSMVCMTQNHICHKKVLWPTILKMAVNHQITICTPPPCMWFEIWLETIPKTLPSITLNLPSSHGNQSYKLSSIIYLDMNHYTCCFLDFQNNIWTYDGQKKWWQT